MKSTASVMSLLMVVIVVGVILLIAIWFVCKWWRWWFGRGAGLAGIPNLQKVHVRDLPTIANAKTGDIIVSSYRPDTGPLFKRGCMGGRFGSFIRRCALRSEWTHVAVYVCEPFLNGGRPMLMEMEKDGLRLLDLEYKVNTYSGPIVLRCFGPETSRDPAVVLDYFKESIQSGVYKFDYNISRAIAFVIRHWMNRKLAQKVIKPTAPESTVCHGDPKEAVHRCTRKYLTCSDVTLQILQRYGAIDADHKWSKWPLLVAPPDFVQVDRIGWWECTANYHLVA